MAGTGTSSPGRYGPNPTTTQSYRGGPIIPSPNIERKTPSAEARLIRQVGNASANTNYNEDYSNEGRNNAANTTVTAASKKSLPPKLLRSNNKNPLNSYRTYNYIFTLAALKRTALTNPLSYRENPGEYFVIAKSGGKGSVGLETPTELANKHAFVPDPHNRKQNAENSALDTDQLLKNQDLVNQFNQQSPGRFDFYINNVNIETIMGASEGTSLSVATKIEFEVTEPYSMNGFLEALQVSAVAAGHEQYADCPYLLKMEFIGYKDDEELPNEAVNDPKNTRYFIFGFTGLDIDVTEQGARYRCSCVPFNEKGFGEPSRLHSNIQLNGTTVQEILKSLEEGLNKLEVADSASEKDLSQANQRDKYEIVFPEVTRSGIQDDSTVNKIAGNKVLEFLKSNTVYKFKDNGESNNFASKRQGYAPREAVTSFSENSTIQDCIISTIRDSEYTTNIIKNLKELVDPNGMVDYFFVHLETFIEGINTTKNKPYFRYKYVVVPYKIHYTRIPGTTDTTVDTTNKFLVSNREYDYLYTGQNVDIQKFNLKFNTLYFQAIPKALGNRENYFGASKSAANPATDAQRLNNVPVEVVQQTSVGKAPKEASREQSNVQTGNDPNGNQIQSSAYYSLARNMHTAVLENVDQCTAEIDIIGDPYYLVTGSIGNYRPMLDPLNYGVTIDGEAAYTAGDILILITFKNPSDIDPVTGNVIFDKAVSLYSGLFRVITVTSRFQNGTFSQTLSLIRVPSQPEDTNQTPSKPLNPTQPKPDPANESTTIDVEPTFSRSTLENTDFSSTGIPTSNIADSSMVADKLGTVASGYTDFATSVEATVNTINTNVASWTPAVGDVSSSVINKFGSVSSQTSPLNSFIQNYNA